jgi:hypothetical protein
MEIGKAYKIHTHLGIWLGRVVHVDPDEITLDQCSWIADEGSMEECTRNGKIVSSDFIGDGVIVPRQGVKIPWQHELPKAHI